MFHEPDGSADLLHEWRWLLGGHARLVGWTASGDLFVTDVRGAVLHLDTGAGQFEEVAPNAVDFHITLRDESQAEALLLLPVVRAFEQRHGPLGSGECRGFTTLPVFGGTYTTENRYRLSIAEHAAFTGNVHRQIRDLPEGAQVQLKIVP